MNSLQLIRRLKKESRQVQKRIRIAKLKDHEAYLRPIHEKSEDAALLAKWRAEHYQSLFTWVQPNEVEMLEWLAGYEDDDTAIMFFVECPAGVPIGQVSIYNVDQDRKVAEFGRLIRGERKGPRGLMSFACDTLIRWSFTYLRSEKIFLEVFADNEKAVALYKRLGFVLSTRLTFKRTINSQNIVQWVESDTRVTSGDLGKNHYREVFKMVLDRKDISAADYV